MLTGLYIDNFRCFVNFEYRPEHKQLLLGANGSGKSSLLEAIRYVKAFVGGADNPFTQSTRTRWQDRPLQVIQINAVLDGREYQYRIEIQIEPETRQPSVNLERLRISGTISFERTSVELHFFSDTGVQGTAKPPDIARSALYLSQVSNPHVGRFMKWLDSVHCFE